MTVINSNETHGEAGSRLHMQNASELFVSVSSTKAGESYTQRIFIICTHPQAGSI
jgi:hypothetical protein